MYASARFAVECVKDPAFRVDGYLLRDHHSGSTARVLPALGNSLMSFGACATRRRGRS